MATSRLHQQANVDRVDSLIGNRVTRRRSQLGLNRSTVALRIGVTLALYESFERGEARPSPEQLRMLADLYQVPVTYFFQDLAFSERDADVSPQVAEAEPVAYTVATNQDRLAVLVADFQKLGPAAQQCLLAVAQSLANDDANA